MRILPRRYVVAVLASAFVLATPIAGLAMTQRHAHEYERAYHAVAHKLGHRAPGRDIVRWGASPRRKATDAQVMASLTILHRMLAPPASTPTSASAAAPTSYSGGDYGDVPGVPSGFASCVAMRESTNGAGSSNIYGIEGSGGQGSLAEQKQTFAQMYAARGSQPWSPYDGC